MFFNVTIVGAGTGERILIALSGKDACESCLQQGIIWPKMLMVLRVRKLIEGFLSFLKLVSWWLK
jgi:hypothetical protein